MKNQKPKIVIKCRVFFRNTGTFTDASMVRSLLDSAAKWRELKAISGTSKNPLLKVIK